MNYIRSLNIFYKLMAVTICLFVISGIFFSFRSENESVVAYSQKGSQGTEVEAVQQSLKDRGLFFEEVTGYFGDKTQEAILRFQKQQGLSQTDHAADASAGDWPKGNPNDAYAQYFSGNSYLASVASGSIWLITMWDSYWRESILRMI